MFFHFQQLYSAVCTARPEDTRNRNVWTSQIHGFALGPNKIKVKVHITQIFKVSIYREFLPYANFIIAN